MYFARYSVNSYYPRLIHKQAPVGINFGFIGDSSCYEQETLPKRLPSRELNPSPGKYYPFFFSYRMQSLSHILRFHVRYISCVISFILISAADSFHLTIHISYNLSNILCISYSKSLICVPRQIVCVPYPTFIVSISNDDISFIVTFVGNEIRFVAQQNSQVFTN